MQTPLIPGLGPGAPELGPLSVPQHAGPPCNMNSLTAQNLALGIGLIVGTFASFVPQYYSIYRRKTTEGLNIATIALGVAATLCIFLNFCYLQWDDKWYCCKQMTFGRCLASTMDGMQILSSVISMLIWTGMWTYYYKIDDSAPGEIMRSYDEIEGRRKLVRWVQIGTGGAVLTLLMNVLLAALFNTTFHASKLASWIGFLLGLAGTAAVIVQWAPQIWTTFKLGSAGSLSVAMLLMQLPGTVTVIYFQSFVNKAHFTTVMPYYMTVIQFVILISLCFFYFLRDRYRMWKAARLADTLPDYKFAHLDDTIASSRVTVPISTDEQEAEYMMNLEEIDEFRPHAASPASATSDQDQKPLLQPHKEKGKDRHVALDSYDDNFGLGPDDDDDGL